MQVSNFNLRVYGLLIHNGHVLVSHEHRAGFDMTKFPGGGLEKGEGLAACLIREFSEELNVEVQIGDFFYVNDFLQISAFNPQDQLVSFYYFVTVESDTLESVHALVNREGVEKEEQHFSWVSLDQLNSEHFTFPIDRVVIEKLKNYPH